MTEESEHSAKKDLFGHALYEIEHALGMYATSFCTLPAEYIYDKDALAPLMDVIASCHIYLIGYTPIVNFVNAEKNGKELNLTFTVGDKEYTVSYDLPAGWSLKQEADRHYLEDKSGRRC